MPTTAHPLNDTISSSVSSNAVSSESFDREQLSLAFRLAEKFGLHEGICNHFSVQLDGEEELYLINPYGVHWSQMRPELLLLINAQGNKVSGEGTVEDSALFIHLAAHKANPRHKAVLHTHMPYATTLTMLDGDAGKLPMSHQTATRFYGRIAYEPNFGGLAHNAEEGERISKKSAKSNANSASDSSDVDILFLAHHGVVVNGSTIALAFDDLYYLERACRQHVFALQTGAPIKQIPEEVVKLTAAQIQRDLAFFAEKHFLALAAVLKEDPNHHFIL
ncbi:MAG: ribulose-5-phosphate 4-epimerase/fuculose-1-phosphate aldolase [Granulosicoccus sp.]|jgi:ribulose-5-phosphate 4-epimerase/fuculose-1-phosphate aldolase